VPFYLRVSVSGRDVSDTVDPKLLVSKAVDVTGVETMTTPVTSNAAITAASAVEAARAVLLDTRQIRHGAGHAAGRAGRRFGSAGMEPRS